jgi:hypothetical protein
MQMSDWTGESIVDGFPRASTTYWIQFITEPEIITKEAQGGRKYKQASVRLQFFMPDEYGEYHYAGWGEKHVQPCVLEQLTEFGPDIMTRLIKVKGVEHKKHVDLELVDSWDKISAKIEPLAPITKPTGGQPDMTILDIPPPPTPPPAVVTLEEQHEPMLDPVATAEPCPPDMHAGPVHHLPNHPKGEGFYCQACGERVG